VRRAGQNVSDARVVLKSASGERTLVFDGDRYRGGHVGYDRYYSLDVTSGADNVRGVGIAGPSLHRITYPLPGATVPPNADLRVTWARSDASDAAQVQTKDFKVESTLDSGGYVVPGSNLQAKVG